MMRCDVLLDVGGTGIKGAAALDGCVPAAYSEFPARSGEEQDVLLAHFAGMIDTLSEGRPVNTVAMAFPGPFDYQKGIPLMRGLAKYESLYGCCIPERLQAIGCAAQDWRFVNDVSAYALGVTRGLALNGRCMCVCLGTGAGSAFCVNGSITEDMQEGVPLHGWIYHLPFGDSIIDDHLSDRGLRKLSRLMMGQEHSPRQLNEMAQHGDAQAKNVWKAFGETAAAALEGVIAQFGADTLVLGGKIALAAGWFAGPLEEMCARYGARMLCEPDTTKYVLLGLNSLTEAKQQGE